MKKVGCIGTGVMGTALMESVAKKIGGESIVVSDADAQKAAIFSKKIGCSVADSNKDIASNCEFVFLAVKPQYLTPILESISPSLSPSTVVVSMAAGIRLDFLKKHLGGHTQIVRIMPNIPATVSEAMIALCASEYVAEKTITEIVEILSLCGLCEITSESLMDAVTAVSGSGPAYGFIFIDALADAAVKMGMPRSQAIRYAAQTLKGAAQMVLSTGMHPSSLKDSVCSPGGTTISAVTKLEEKGFRSAIIQAALAAWERSIELGKQ